MGQILIAREIGLILEYKSIQTFNELATFIDNVWTQYMTEADVESIIKFAAKKQQDENANIEFENDIDTINLMGR